MTLLNDIHQGAQAPLETAVVVIDWRPCNKNTLRGFAKIKIAPWHLIVDGVAVHEKDGRSWAQLPARPQVDRDGTVLREDTGKIKYARILEFTSKEVGWRFSDAVVAAVKKAVAQ